MMAFVRRARIAPVVSRVARGGLGDLEGIEALFADIRAGRQFGKLVVEIAPPDGDEDKDGAAKL